MGTITLVYNPSPLIGLPGWYGTTPATVCGPGSNGVSLVCGMTGWTLTSAGPTPVFGVAATPAIGCSPFLWSGSGIASASAGGACDGGFTAVVSEEP